MKGITFNYVTKESAALVFISEILGKEFKENPFKFITENCYELSSDNLETASDYHNALLLITMTNENKLPEFALYDYIKSIFNNEFIRYHSECAIYEEEIIEEVETYMKNIMKQKADEFISKFPNYYTNI